MAEAKLAEAEPENSPISFNIFSFSSAFLLLDLDLISLKSQPYLVKSASAQ